MKGAWCRDLAQGCSTGLLVLACAGGARKEESPQGVGRSGSREEVGGISVVRTKVGASADPHTSVDERQHVTPGHDVDSPSSAMNEPERELRGAPELTPSPQILHHFSELEGFYLALDELRAKRRRTPVRILWMGDSHTAADFMTQPIREYLAEIAGDGGPGFVRLGLEGYRHGAARVTSFGTVGRAPILPAQRTRVLDGIFGYGGIRTRPQSASGVDVEMRNTRKDQVTWTLSYRLQDGAALDLRLGDHRERIRGVPERASVGGIESFSMKGSGVDRFGIRHFSGDPEVFGVFCEYVEPGVVLDTSGIDGARTATALAWESTQFIQQLRLRDPQLLVLAYGTNEIFDKTSVSHYAEQTVELVTRAREANPEIPCWVLGPPDAAKKSGGSLSRVVPVTDAQREAAKSMGCAFTSIMEIMGGEGSFSRWMRERPALARGDHVHFTIAGYRKLGELLARRLVTVEQIGGIEQEAKARTSRTEELRETESAP